MEESCGVKGFVNGLVDKYNEDESRSWTVKGHARSNKDKSYFHFQCVRGDSKKPSAKSHRNVGCEAYISFTVLQEYKAVHELVVVERVLDTHSGHDSGMSERHENPIVKALVDKIKEWIEIGVKPDVILLLAHKWSRDAGYQDLSDRRYYVTPDDITNLKKLVQRSKQLHKDDSVSLDKFVRSHQSSVIHYAPYIPGTQPLLLILMSELMRRNFVEFGTMLFLDATGNTNSYGFPLYALLVRDGFGRGTPAAYIVTSSEDQNTLTSALQHIKIAHPQVVPR